MNEPPGLRIAHAILGGYNAIDHPAVEPKALAASALAYIGSSPFENPEPYFDIIKALGTRKKLSSMTRKELLSATKAPDTGTFSKDV